ncbi:MAG: endonuclease/exonuclease/phosphatase family protein [Phycisphaerales bacterium]
MGLRDERDEGAIGLRLLSYNIRAALGMDGVRSIERIGEVIAGCEADVVGLQEVDFLRTRSGRVDQGELLGSLCGMECVGGASLREADGGGYGNAVLSRHAVRLVDRVALPHLAGTEPRSAMVVEVSGGGGEGEGAEGRGGSRGGWSLRVVNTHLSFRRRDRAWQLEALLGERVLGGGGMGRRCVLMGDLNCGVRDRWFRRVRASAGLRDPGSAVRHRPVGTWPTRRAFRWIDHVVATEDVRIVGARVVRTSRSRMASDHFPLLVDVELSSGGVG